MNNEPVAYGMLTFCKNCGEQNPYAVKELTDEEIEDECRKAWGLHDQDQLNLTEVFKFARAILRKAQEK